MVGGGWVLVAGGSKIKTELSPQLGLAKLELGLSLAITGPPGLGIYLELPLCKCIYRENIEKTD